MGTLVSFHAHPDDESIAMGGTLARAADEGHRVVLVFATRGEVGEVPDGFLDEGEELATRREVETRRSAEVLGAARVAFLDYRDSGMMGTDDNDVPGSFWSADVEVAAHQLAALLVEEDADVLTTYDAIGGYGHPDHIQVHRVGTRAAQLASTPRVYESTINRDHVMALWAQAAADGQEREAGGLEDLEPEEFGVPAETITTFVDVLPYIRRKRASMRAHASQIAEDSWFLKLDDDAFAAAFGTEWYIRADAPAGCRDDWLFP